MEFADRIEAQIIVKKKPKQQNVGKVNFVEHGTIELLDFN